MKCSWQRQWRISQEKDANEAKHTGPWRDWNPRLQGYSAKGMFSLFTLKKRCVDAEEKNMKSVCEGSYSSRSSGGRASRVQATGLVLIPEQVQFCPSGTRTSPVA